MASTAVETVPCPVRMITSTGECPYPGVGLVDFELFQELQFQDLSQVLIVVGD
jgi:hypothetical protein